MPKFKCYCLIKNSYVISIKWLSANYLAWRWRFSFRIVVAWWEKLSLKFQLELIIIFLCRNYTFANFLHFSSPLSTFLRRPLELIKILPIFFSTCKKLCITCCINAFRYTMFIYFDWPKFVHRFLFLCFFFFHCQFSHWLPVVCMLSFISRMFYDKEWRVRWHLLENWKLVK